MALKLRANASALTPSSGYSRVGAGYRQHQIDLCWYAGADRSLRPSSTTDDLFKRHRALRAGRNHSGVVTRRFPTDIIKTLDIDSYIDPPDGMSARRRNYYCALTVRA